MIWRFTSIACHFNNAKFLFLAYFVSLPYLDILSWVLGTSLVPSLRLFNVCMLCRSISSVRAAVGLSFLTPLMSLELRHLYPVFCYWHCLCFNISWIVDLSPYFWVASISRLKIAFVGLVVMIALSRSGVWFCGFLTTLFSIKFWINVPYILSI